MDSYTYIYHGKQPYLDVLVNKQLKCVWQKGVVQLSIARLATLNEELCEWPELLHKCLAHRGFGVCDEVGEKGEHSVECGLVAAFECGVGELSVGGVCCKCMFASVKERRNKKQADHIRTR